MAYAPHIASKRAFRRFKRNFTSRLYEGKVGLFGMLRHWWTVRGIVKQRD